MTLPSFSFEKKLAKKGYKIIAGVDEVGRGCFAGPVVAGCVIFPSTAGPAGSSSRPTSSDEPAVTRRDSLRFRHPRVIINDSKKMTPKQREVADEWIKENALAWGIGEASVRKINSFGMAKATKMAFRQAISDARKRLGGSIDFLLADAFFISYVPGLPAKRRKNKKGRFYKKTNGRQMAIINGDEKSVSIAAASIIAKVYRDKLMIGLSKQPKYRKYGWGRNKGYGTKEHQKAIKKYGITRQHRKQFVETWINNSSFSLTR